MAEGRRLEIGWFAAMRHAGSNPAISASVHVYAEVAQRGRASDRNSERRRFDPGLLHQVIPALAQSDSERRATNAKAAGSSPAGGSSFNGGVAQLVQSTRLLPDRFSVRDRAPSPENLSFEVREYKESSDLPFKQALAGSSPAADTNLPKRVVKW